MRAGFIALALVLMAGGFGGCGHPKVSGRTDGVVGDPTATSVGTDATELSESGDGSSGDSTVTTSDPGPGWPGFPVDEGPPPFYGFWGLNGFVTPRGFEEVKGALGLTVFQTANEDPVWTVGTLLPQVRSAGLHVTLRLTGGPEYYTEAGGFNLAAWKSRLSAWRASGLQPFIDDGTLVGHMLLDDVVNFDTYDPTAADFEEMARTSKDLFPGLMTFVRQKATDLPVPAGGRYRWLDAQVNQYEAMEGPVRDYAVAQAARARLLGLGVINGLNIADGGDGSSRQPGYRSKHWAMSAEEITHYGETLLAVPTCGMFLNWEYDAQEPWSDGTIGADYFRRAGLQAALYGLSVRIGVHPHVRLLKPASGLLH